MRSVEKGFNAAAENIYIQPGLTNSYFSTSFLPGIFTLKLQLSGD
jgi:hypothetical protein